MTSEKPNAHLEHAGTKKADCLFCSIHHKEINATFIYEDDTVFAIKDINPQAPTHILVIPRKHIDNISMEENKELIGSVFYAAARIAEKEKLTGGFRLVVNTGDDGGQTVHHLHIHLLGGRSLTWPPG